MIHLIYGTDREKVRATLQKLIAKEKNVLRITDVHTRADIQVALGGSGLFGEKKTVVLDGVWGKEEMRVFLKEALQLLPKEENVILVEGALDAASKKILDKCADIIEKFDLPKQKVETTIFALANALQKGDKKNLWIGLQKEFARGAVPEAVHGVLFWAAKQQHLKTPSERSARLVAELAELPHLSRRKGIELEYTLERFALSLT